VPFVMDHWIKEDPTVEMRETFIVRLSFKVIISGPPPLRITAYSLQLSKPSGEVFFLHSERLLMYSLALRLLLHLPLCRPHLPVPLRPSLLLNLKL